MDGTQGAMRACAKLKQQRPYLKLIVSVGGAEGNNQDFATIASNAQKRTNFAYTARQLIDQYNFDGIDGTWLCSSIREATNDGEWTGSIPMQDSRLVTTYNSWIRYEHIYLHLVILSLRHCQLVSGVCVAITFDRWPRKSTF
jgi:hypothetical protein